MGEGTNKIGNYEVVQKIGAGVVGTVYKAKQLTMERFVALKVLNSRYSKDPSFVKRFIDEARTAGKVNHANICQVYEVGHEGGVYFFSMELVDGPTLEERLKSHGRLGSDETLDYLNQAASALDAAHRNGLVHRDVKPANLMVNSTGVVKLVDLGLARDNSQPVQQMELGLAGTPYYMAPEQGQGLQVDIRSDIYALGATFYHLLIGKPPFSGPHATAVLMKHAAEPLTPPSEIDPSIPRHVSAIIEKMMAKSADERYQTPGEVLKAVEEAKKGGGAPITVRPTSASGRKRAVPLPSVPVRAPRRAQGRSNAMPAAIGGGVLMLLILGAVFGLRGEDPRFAQAEERLAEANRLAAQGEITPLADAAALARSIIGAMPDTAKGKRVEQSAERFADNVEGRILKAISREIGTRIDAVRDGRLEAAVVLRRIEQLKARYEDAAISRRIRDEAEAYFAKAIEGVEEASKVLAKIDDVPANEEPEDDGTFAVLRKEINDLLRDGKYARAKDVVDAMLDAVEDPAEKRKARDLRAKVVAEAASAFGKTLGRVSAAMDGRRDAEARRLLLAAQKNFAFDPYDRRIAELLQRVGALAGGKPASEREAKQALARGIETVVELIQSGDREAARRQIQRLRASYGRTDAYRRRSEELDILKGLLD